VEQIFNENHVKDQTQVDLVVLGFFECAKTWWHKVCKNYDQGPPATSWMDIKTLMCARFVPPSYRKELLLKLQRLHQGLMCVSEYFKELESQMFGAEHFGEFIHFVFQPFMRAFLLREWSSFKPYFALASGGIHHSSSRLPWLLLA